MTWMQRGISLFRQAIGGRGGLKSSITRQKSKAAGGDGCPVECWMDEIMHPEGCWAEGYKKRDAVDTKTLVVGVALFVPSLLMYWRTESVKGYPEVTVW